MECVECRVRKSTAPARRNDFRQVCSLYCKPANSKIPVPGRRFNLQKFHDQERLRLRDFHG